MVEKSLNKAFLYLYVSSMAGIFLHELGHHLFGIPSLLGLSHNYPLVRVTPENIRVDAVGTLAGPVVNVILGYLGVCLYWLGDGRASAARLWGLFGGLANLFLAVSGAIINLVVDLASHSWGNDLEVVSAHLGWNVLILPAVFVGISLPGLAYLFSRWDSGKPGPGSTGATGGGGGTGSASGGDRCTGGKRSGGELIGGGGSSGPPMAKAHLAKALVIFWAWLVGGITLMSLDAIFQVRFSLRGKF